MTQYVWIQSLHILLQSLYWIKEDMGAFEPKRNPNLKATSLRPPMGINNSLDQWTNTYTAHYNRSPFPL